MRFQAACGIRAALTERSSKTIRTQKPRKALEGIRVLDMTNVLAGPFATLHLALLGAEVIKIENPTDGDLARKLGNVPKLNKELMGTSFLAQNSNKKSLTLNLKSAGRPRDLQEAGRDRRRAGGELPARRHEAPGPGLPGAGPDQSAPHLLRHFRLRPDRARRPQAGLRPDHPGPERGHGDQRRRAAQPAARRLPGVRHGGRPQRRLCGARRAVPSRADRRGAVH